jgi:two-component system phosphate regulon sensor histidine kinase PhoR
VLNEIRTYLKSSRTYLIAGFLFTIAAILITIIINDDKATIIVFSFILFLIVAMFLYLFGKWRNKELDQIKNIINKIRTRAYKSVDEIELSDDLILLETAIKKMYEQSKNDIEYLEKLQKMRSQFVANVSHELRTPIFAIQGYIETLLEGAINDPGVNTQFLQKANQHTINLSNLINDLIDISMIESGEMRMSFRYFGVNDYLTAIIDEMKPLARERGLELVYNQVRDGLEIFGDKDRLKQAFVNIIHNSIKYTEHGKIEVMLEKAKKSVKFTVKDTGIGIPASSINRIFERFYRVDKARSHSVGGTGLGLAIVKHILEAHNSEVEVKSTINEGSEFSFILSK